jgi:hypothetical protein
MKKTKKKNKRAKKQLLKSIFMSVVSVVTLVLVVISFTARRNVTSLLLGEQQPTVEQPAEPIETCDSTTTALCDSLVVEPTAEPTSSAE